MFFGQNAGLQKLINVRKRYKKKLHNCALCKPHKMRITRRWSDSELIGLKEFERERKLTEGALF